MTPGDPLTLPEAAAILGCSTSTVRRQIFAGRLPTTPRYRHRQFSRADVEHLALQTYRWRLHLYDVEPYWITGERAADVLGVNVARLNVLAGKGFIPFETAADGTRLFRSQQLEVVAHARQERRH